ncbi:hypothetical protein BG011_001554 [Mortierella polycephala]|uniref:BTB domain-containing protein n=1 Tax=Mortierella polycephala TaxID=41804 RepID=A0A9P6Q9J2_9FUNG|nr:hypothetical protein BG011_001554 [Mortierella polycephala]
MNNRTDSVLGESSLSFWINLEPTQFRGQFCEPVTRQLVFGGGPSSDQAHQWVVAFTENMINGVVTVDIDVWRIEAEAPQPPQQELSKLQQQQPQLWDEEEQQQHKRSSRPKYKTIAIHTPMVLLPVSTMSIANGATEESPIHSKFLLFTLYFFNIGLDASSIEYRHRFIIEIVLSEEHSSYQIPNPLASNRILDSLMYNVVATAAPSQVSADIWFEFPSTEESSPNTLSARGHYTPIFGAHSRVLSKHRYFKNWIDRERRNQEAQRRRQLDEERRIYQQQQAMKVGAGQIQLWPIYPEQQLQMTMTETSPRIQSVLQQTDTEQQYLPQQSLPALRIPVTDIPFGAFQVLLQFLYTGQICLTDEQVRKVEDYWNMNPEDRYRLEDEDGMPKECGPGEDAKSTRGFPEAAPIQLPNPTKDPKDPLQPQVSITDALNSWLDSDEAKSRTRVENGVEGESKGEDDRDDENKGDRVGGRHRARQSCSWEMLLTISKRLELSSLEEMAKKALQYRLQMKTLQITISPHVMTKVAHNGFGDAKLDLQLAQGEQVLWSFLQLYHSSLRIQGEVMAIEDTVENVEQNVEKIRREQRRGWRIGPLERGQDEIEMEPSERDQEQERGRPRGTREFRRQGHREEQFFHHNAWDGTWTGTTGSGEDGDESSGVAKVYPEVSRSLFDNPECEKAIAELCRELRSTFLRMRDIKSSDDGH